MSQVLLDTGMPVNKSCPSCECVVNNRKVICPICGYVLHKRKPEDAKRRTLKRACATNKVAVETLAYFDVGTLANVGNRALAYLDVALVCLH